MPRHFFADSIAIGTTLVSPSCLENSDAVYVAVLSTGMSSNSVVAMHTLRQYSSRWCATGAVLVAALLLSDQIVEHVSAAEEVERVVVAPGKAQQVVSLRDRLVVGLQARLKSEVAFVELVVARVRTGHLPQRLVDETFFWARQRAADRRTGRSRRPIIFFQPAMTARAKRLRVEL